MPVYTCIMIAITVGLFAVGLLFLAGQYGWFYLFNRSNQRDDKEYSRFLGKSVMALGVVTLVSGGAYMIAGTIPAVVLLVVGVVAAMAAITKSANQYYK